MLLTWLLSASALAGPVLMLSVTSLPGRRSYSSATVRARSRPRPTCRVCGGEIDIRTQRTKPPLMPPLVVVELRRGDTWQRA